MPPTRTITPAKAVKTERTHEENQERAYIAASRRSDRSLEARVESARRASEIHKRRTGRSLRVTEQDVINEEMYEEEDDDLPMHYRRLTAHLQTGSVDFNRRLAAYLTNQIAMRSAMDQMINNSYAQQYPNAPQFAHNTPGVYPSPMANSNNHMPSPTSTYRAAPYPSLHQPNFRNMHVRANSVATPSDLSNNQQSLAYSSPGSSTPTPSLDARRMSLPATTTPATRSPLQTSDTKSEEQQRETQPANTVHESSNIFAPLWQDHSMFTTTLPPESQQMLAPALDPNDPLSANLMAGSEQFLSNPHYPWPSSSANQSLKSMTSSPTQVHPSFDGMLSTLAPSALQFNGGNESYTLSSSTSGASLDTSAAPSTGIDFNLSQDSTQLKGMHMSGASQFMGRDNSSGSGQATPGEGFWESFVQDGIWTGDGSSS